MTTPSELPATEEAAPLEGRLHPWSWLFALIAQLQSFALPLIALLVFGSRGNGDERWQFIGMLAGLVIVVVSVVQYFTYRYGVVGDDLVIREGILHRNRRNIPMQRIRNVSLQQNLLHRLFGVAEVRLESAGGHGAEPGEGLEGLVDDLRVRRIVEGEQMAEHVEARLFEGGDAGAAALDRRHAELLEALEGLADGAAVHAEALGEVALGGQALAAAVLAAQDVVAEGRRDGRLLGDGGRGHDRKSSSRARGRSGRTNMARP